MTTTPSPAQPATAPPPSARRQATRERLLDAAVELFGERGVLGSSVEEICDRAGFTRGAFYSNFDSKNELCLAVMRRKCEQNLAAMQAALAVIPELPGPSADADELIRAAVGVFLDAQPKKSAELVAMMELRLHAVRTPELRAGWLAVHEAISTSVGGLLEIAVARVGAQLTRPTAEVTELLGAAYENLISLGLLRGESRPSDLAGQLAAVLGGFIAPGEPGVGGSGRAPTPGHFPSHQL